MTNHPNLSKFVAVIQKLRGPGGCPWDKKQTHKSLKQYLLEETYEVLDAIDKNNNAHLREELGDLLLQILLHSQIAADHQQFDIEDVAKEITEKMIRRHPHVFGNHKVKNADEVVKNWEEIKATEKSEHTTTKSLLASIPRCFPALFENYKISKKVAKLGFDWKKPEDVFAKIAEEIQETKKAIRSKNKNKIEEELGDLLFATANLCRAYKVNPEIALNKANQKFRKRFFKMERKIKKEKWDINKLSFDQWDNLWKRIK